MISVFADMTTDNYIALAVSVAVLILLVLVLIYPEKF
ncbi:MAG TPA: potassium-transporting ATPase subunit F [Acidimicrobiales bacterium]|nr:potassium-transporting ATPase subunit F [Acidimicrobiales bacterium]